MKIAIVYESKREAYRIRRIKRKLKRLGISAARAVQIIALAGAVISACLMDSENLTLVLRGFAVCVILALLAYVGLRIEKT